MGTYTTNKNLFMPTVGEQGWGELVNGNFSTIDTFLKPITVSGSTYTFTGNHVGNQSGGSISATSITNSGTLTQTGTSTFTGKITANGGIGTKALTATSITNSGALTQTGTSTFTGKITANGGVNDYEERITALESGEFETITVADKINGNLVGLHFVPGVVQLEGDVVYATCAEQDIGSASSTFTVNDYTIPYVVPCKHCPGVYTRDSDLSGELAPTLTTRTGILTNTGGNVTVTPKITKVSDGTTKTYTLARYGGTATVTFEVGEQYTYTANYSTLKIYASPTYYVKYASP